MIGDTVAMEPVNLVVAAAIITGLVQALKRAVHAALEVAGRLVTDDQINRFAPLLSIVLGVLMALPGWIDGGPLAGIIAGLTASGLYSGGKAAVVEPARDYLDHPDRNP